MMHCRTRKSVSYALAALTLAGFSALPAWAGDDPATERAQGRPAPLVAPVEGVRTFTTTVDNQDNAGTGIPDNDMGVYLCRSAANVPIEFDITLPPAGNPIGGVLRMEVYDVDTSTTPGNPEVDVVYLNGVQVGILNGSNNNVGVNVFNIPPGVLRVGKNLVQIEVDTTAGGWCVSVDWGSITVNTPHRFMINRAWVAPVTAFNGDFVNVFAEATGPTTKLSRMAFMVNGNEVASMTDPDGDGTYSGEYQVSLPAGVYDDISIKAYDANGKTLTRWPMLMVTDSAPKK